MNGYCLVKSKDHEFTSLDANWDGIDINLIFLINDFENLEYNHGVEAF